MCIRSLHCRKIWERFVCPATDDDDDGKTNADGAVNGDEQTSSLYSRIKSSVAAQEPFVFEVMETQVVFTFEKSIATATVQVLK
jgi:hypothetical protein